MSPSSIQPLTYDHIERTLREAINLQESLTNQHAALGDELAKADTAFKRAKAEARVQYRDEKAGSKVTESMIEDAWTLATLKEYEGVELAKLRYENCKQRLYSVRERMNALRSLMASHRVATGDAS